MAQNAVSAPRIARRTDAARHERTTTTTGSGGPALRKLSRGPIRIREQSGVFGGRNRTAPVIARHDAISALLTSPRKLKHFIRDVDRAWTQLRGEVELNDLIVLTVLRHAVPEVWDFIVENVEAARSERRERDDFAGEGEKTIAATWERVRSSVAEPSHVQHLVDVLDLPQLASKSAVSSQESLQGIHNDGPVDYLGRILAGQVLPGDIWDQEVRREIEGWKTFRPVPMIDRLTAATETSDQYADIWEHYADRLSDDELIEITGQLIAALLQRDRADASMQHPAMLAVWRRCNRRHALRDTR